MKTSKFYIANMDCPTEEQLIRKKFTPIEGVEKLDFNLMQRELNVTHQRDDEALFSALHSIGMEAKLRADVNAFEHGQGGKGGCQHCACGQEEKPGCSTKRLWALLGISGITAVAAEALAWITGGDHSSPVILLALLSIATGGRDTFRKGWIALKTLTLNINFLMMIAVAGAVAIGQWPEAAMVTFLFAIAELIEAYSLDQARNAIRGLMELTPETASVRSDDGTQWREMQASEVKVGQMVRVRPGERIPLDGTVMAGQSSVNQAPITGESIPAEKKVGDPVFAGSINERGSFEFEVTANQGNTTLARIVRSVQQAHSERAPTQRFVDRFARFYTPTVVILATLVAVAPPLLFGGALIPWLYKALVMLVIACPCALVISTPAQDAHDAIATRHWTATNSAIQEESGRRLIT